MIRFLNFTFIFFTFYSYGCDSCLDQFYFSLKDAYEGREEFDNEANLHWYYQGKIDATYHVISVMKHYHPEFINSDINLCIQ